MFGIKKNGVGKKAFVFTIDAFLAGTVLIAGLLLLSNYVINEHPRESIEYYSFDVLIVLSEMKMSELSTDKLNYFMSASNLTDENLTILEQAGTYWASERPDLAANLTSGILANLIPQNTGFSISMNDVLFFEKNNSLGRNQVYSADRMITGVLEGAPLEGSTSSAYLRKISDKRTSSFAYFGGFVGQGNVSILVDEFPIGISNSEITRMTLELDAGANFSFYINNIFCSNLSVLKVANLTPTKWDVSYCNSSIYNDRMNNISIKFNSPINNSFIAGGYFRIDYKSGFAQENTTLGYKKVYLPEIIGVANLYDSIYVPGTLRNLTIHLDYSSNSKTYLTVGSTIVHQQNANGTVNVTLQDSELKSFPINLNYNDLSNKTIPIRFASYNETYNYVLGTDSDVVLVTDLSGSMKYRMNSWTNPGNAIPNCNPSDIADPSSRRLGVAACLDADVNAIIMNSSIPNNTNRLWLVDFSENANPFYSSNLALLDEENIDDEISTRYKSKSQHEIQGGTCICCAINQAYEILKNYSSVNRTKSVIVMTDGVPTYCCGGYFNGGVWSCNTTATGTNRAWPLASQSTGCFGDLDDCNGNDCNGPIQSAINAAERLHRDLNVTVYGIGFGPVDTCYNANYTVAQIAEKGNGSFFAGQNGTLLQSFYKNISQKIISQVVQSSQLVSSQGNVSNSELYSSSFIEYFYEPIVDPYLPNEISVAVQTKQFNTCDPIINIPLGLRVIDSKIVSYSGNHWTDSLTVDSVEVYNLTKYGANYYRLGDPYIIQVPSNLLLSGNRSFSISTADSPTNKTGCSFNNTLIYSALVPSATSRSGVVENTDGCEWTIQFEDDTNNTKKIPSSYSGSKKCSYMEQNYTLASGAYDSEDAYDIAVYNMLKALDFDNNGKVFVNLDSEDIEIVITTISSVPYLWGPSTVEATTWQ